MDPCNVSIKSLLFVLTFDLRRVQKIDIGKALASWRWASFRYERPVNEHGKKMKDLRQSSLLFKVLHEERPGDLRLAWQALVARGKSWEKKAREGFVQTCQFNPDTPAVIDI